MLPGWCVHENILQRLNPPGRVVGIAQANKRPYPAFGDRGRNAAAAITGDIAAIRLDIGSWHIAKCAIALLHHHPKSRRTQRMFLQDNLAWLPRQQEADLQLSGSVDRFQVLQRELANAQLFQHRLLCD
jgi:hypothetical protein